MTTEASRHEPTDYDLPEPEFALRAFRDDVLQGIGDPERAVVDVRSPAEYAGELLAPPALP